jgi:hypothetical protein
MDVTFLADMDRKQLGPTFMTHLRREILIHIGHYTFVLPLVFQTMVQFPGGGGWPTTFGTMKPSGTKSDHGLGTSQPFTDTQDSRTGSVEGLLGGNE